MVRILIADDHPVVRSGIKSILAGERDLHVQGEAGSADELLALLRKRKYDVVVTDLSLPDSDGIELIEKVREEHSDAPILVLSIHPEEHLAVRCLKAGATGYLNKKSTPEQLVEAVRCVASGRTYLSASLAEDLVVRAENRGKQPLHDTLSEREYQVMILIASGTPIGQIAKHLALSAKTVSTYRSRILQKMQMRTSSELTRYVFEHHLLD